MHKQTLEKAMNQDGDFLLNAKQGGAGDSGAKDLPFLGKKEVPGLPNGNNEAEETDGEEESEEEELEEEEDDVEEVEDDEDIEEVDVEEEMEEQFGGPKIRTTSSFNNNSSQFKNYYL